MFEPEFDLNTIVLMVWILFDFKNQTMVQKEESMEHSAQVMQSICEIIMLQID